jgi:pentatricopeptide repeat protein
VILPYTHEDLVARRWPILTIALIVVNLFALVLLEAASSAHQEQVVAVGEDAVRYFADRPYLEVCPPLARVHVLPRLDPEDRPPPPRGLSPAALADEQRELDALCTRFADAMASMPTHRYGYVPAEDNALGLLTYSFLHGGWVHLISNLWFLWLCGCNLEDRWGRAVFLLFYVSAGVVSGLAQKVATPDSTIPVIGASGAIAGAMGAFLVAFAKTRIKFLYMLFIRFGTFTAPAYVMLPLWLLSEIVWGLAGDRGVAHWVHVGGFVYGTCFALALRTTGIERRLDAAVEKSITVAQDPRIVLAGERIDAGAPYEAIRLLEQVAAEKPKSIDALLELLRAAKAAGDQARELSTYARLIDVYLEIGSPETAIDLYFEMKKLGLHERLVRGCALRVAEQLAARGQLEPSLAAYAAACPDGLVDVVAGRAAIARAAVAARLGRSEAARAILTEARASPFSNASTNTVIDAELARLERAPW